MAEQVEKLGTLKERAADMLSSLIDSATQAGEFIQDQIPLVIRELLAYHTALYALGVVVGIGILVGLFFWLRFCIRKYNEDEFSSWDGAAFLTGTCIGLPAFIMLAMSSTGLLKITLAPRVWLIEYAAELVK